MSKLRSSWLALALCAGLLGSAGARAEDDEALGFERTPPRLSFLDGEVSYFRPGADDWTTAVVNTALAPGDELATGAGANLELQVGAHGFARAGENTQLALTSLEPDFQQVRVTSGHVSLDLRSLQSGQTFEVDTPNSAFTIDRAGYYRVAVEGATTTFISRRGGRATLTPAAGESLAIAANEQVVVTGEDTPQVETYAAPELDAWDRWNYARTDEQQGSVSARYVPSGVYGTSDLDHYGDWRVVPSYGSIWVPRGVAAGWAPYSTGRWVYDPYYGWTWVDDYAWGWAPYHYGRWVHYSGYWGWCPGPIVARPYYSPALVAFYGGGFSVGVTFGVPYVGWVALGWGEPLIPWWGPARFRAYPRWGGWGGPRFVNNVAFHHNTVYNINQINVYRNAGVRNAFVAVNRDRFGRRWQDGNGSSFTRVRDDQRGQFSPLRGDPGVRPDRSSLVADARSARRPSREDRQRSVVATRQPRFDRVQGLDTSRGVRDGRGRDGRARAQAGAPDGLPAARLVEPSREVRRNQVSRRQSFGAQGDGERRVARPEPRFRQRETAAQASPPAARDDARERGPRAERSRTAAPSGRGWQSSAPTRDQAERARGASPDRAERQRAARPERNFARPEPPAQRAERARPERGESSGRREQASASQRALPGERANREFQPRGQQRPERAERAPRQQQQIARAGREPRVERSAPAPQRERPARQPQMERTDRQPQMQARADRSDWQSRPQWSPRESQRAPEARPQFQARAQGGERSGEVRSRGNGGGGGGWRGGDPQVAGDGGGSSWNGGGGNGGGGGWNGGGGRGAGGGGRGGGNFGGGGRGSRGR